MEYATQITFREQWRDDRLVFDDLNGQIRFLTLTDPNRIWKPDLFFSNGEWLECPAVDVATTYVLSFGSNRKDRVSAVVARKQAES